MRHQTLYGSQLRRRLKLSQELCQTGQFFSDLLRLRMAAVEEQCCALGVFGRSGNTGQQHWTTGGRFSPYHWVNQSDKQKPPVILSPSPHPSECVVRTKMRVGCCAIEPFESPLLFGISA